MDMIKKTCCKKQVPVPVICQIRKYRRTLKFSSKDVGNLVKLFRSIPVNRGDFWSCEQTSRGVYAVVSLEKCFRTIFAAGLKAIDTSKSV